MDALAALGQTSQVNSSSSVASKNVANFDAFLQLLVAQLKNQDPSAPTDSKEFLAQLASFSSVEQQVQTNAKLDYMLGINSQSWAISLIDKTITSADGKTSGVVASVVFKDTGPQAILENGKTVDITEGIKIERTSESKT